MFSCRFYASAEPEVVCAAKCLMLRQIMSIKILFKYFLWMLRKTQQSLCLNLIIFPNETYPSFSSCSWCFNQIPNTIKQVMGNEISFYWMEYIQFNCRENGFIHVVYKTKLFWCLIISFYYGKVGLRGDSPLCQMLTYTPALGSLA